MLADSHRGSTHGILRGGHLLLVGLDRPVEHVVVLESLSDEQVSEQLSQVRVIGLVVESERSAVVEVDGELVGETSAESLGWRRHLCIGVSGGTGGAGLQSDSLFSMIRSYFCFLVAAFNPCHGSWPRRKY